MNNESFAYDDITFLLENYLTKNKIALSKEYDLLYEEATKCFKDANFQDIARTRLSSLLLGQAEEANLKLKNICEKESVDFWLTLIRRYTDAENVVSLWRFYAQLAILKYSCKKSTNVLFPVKGENSFGIAMTYPEEFLLDSFRIHTYAMIIAQLLSFNRIVTKGGKLKYNIDGKLTSDMNMELKRAVESYDQRRSVDFLFADEAVPTEYQNTKPTDQTILLLFQNVKPIPIYCPFLNLKLNLINYHYEPADLRKIMSTLLIYEEAIRDVFNFSVEAIAQIIYTISMSIMNFHPKWTITDGTFYDMVVGEDKINLDKLRFTFNLCQLGYMRYPMNIIKNRLKVHPYRNASKEEVDAWINSFFDSQFLNEKWEDEINVLRLTKFPFIFKSPAEHCYIDLFFFPFFLQWIIKKAKMWYETQHGDRFTLLVKNYLKKLIPGIEVLGQDNQINRELFADLIVIRNETVYYIECKAHAKSSDYIIGSVDAVNQRNSLIARDIKQAKNTLDKIKKSTYFNKYQKFDWVVCTSSHEFICPIEKYGMLNDKTPKVCTVEELSRCFR